MSNLKVEVWWGPRAEALNECAKRGANLLHRLQPLHPSFAQWYEKAMSRKLARESPVHDLSASRLLPLMAARQQTDTNGKNILGFRWGVWNGADTEEASVSVSVKCGGYHEQVRWNSASVGLPDEGILDPITTPSGVKPVLAALIATYEPEWGLVSNLLIFRATKDLLLEHKPCVGWMTWLRGPALPAGGPVDGLGDDATVEPFEGGALITLGQRPMHHDNPEDIARIRDAWLKLREAGYPL
ncbi:MAG: immunity 52 family protein [Alphaproteobacteria bacterium]|nr:immunity 52 family protein [Alphaproteobacteria bacterium]